MGLWKLLAVSLVLTLAGVVGGCDATTTEPNCEGFSLGSSGPGCTAEWTCDDGVLYRVECAPDGADMACRCYQAGVEQRSFTSQDFCDNQDLATSTANSACQWDLRL